MSHEKEEEVGYRQEEEEEVTVAVVVAGVSLHHNMDHSETLRWLNQQRRFSLANSPVPLLLSCTCGWILSYEGGRGTSGA